MFVSKDTKSLVKVFNEFYKNKFNGDIEKAQNEIEMLQITALYSQMDRIVIRTCRPGPLIGKHGENVDALAKAFDRKIKVIEEENHLNYYLGEFDDDY